MSLSLFSLLGHWKPPELLSPPKLFTGQSNSVLSYFYGVFSSNFTVDHLNTINEKAQRKNASPHWHEACLLPLKNRSVNGQFWFIMLPLFSILCIYTIIDSVDMNLSKLWKTAKDREAWHAAVYGVTKSRTRLGDWTATTVNHLFPHDSY